MSTHRYVGTIVSKATGAPVAEAMIEAYDCANVVPGVVAVATSNELGTFEIEMDTAAVDRLFGGAAASLFFRVTNSGYVVASTERTNRWNPRVSTRGTVFAEAPL